MFIVFCCGCCGIELPENVMSATNGRQVLRVDETAGSTLDGNVVKAKRGAVLGRCGEMRRSTLVLNYVGCFRSIAVRAGK